MSGLVAAFVSVSTVYLCASSFLVSAALAVTVCSGARTLRAVPACSFVAQMPSVFVLLSLCLSTQIRAALCPVLHWSSDIMTLLCHLLICCDVSESIAHGVVQQRRLILDYSFGSD